ncbi:MAG: MFS transporter [Halieaceae bacterium]|nr:MFS transporter [Halieaceae bacterium]
MGGTHYVFGVYLVPVTAEYGISRSEGNLGFIALMAGIAVWSPIVGRLLDALSANTIMKFGAISLGAGLIACSYVPSPAWIPALIAVPVSFGSCACGSLAANTVAVRWFQQRRGQALGILSVSTSAGGLLLTPAAAILVDNFGWRTALQLQGVFVMTLMYAMTVIFIRNTPQGDEPGYNREFDSGASAAGDTAEHANAARSTAALFRDKRFWLLTLGIGLLLASDQALLVSQVPFFVSIGLSLQQGAFVASLMTFSAITGKLLVGYMADRINLFGVYLMVACCHILLLLVFSLQPAYFVIITAAAVFGIAVGWVYPVWMTLLASQFGAKNYGATMGLMVVLMQPIAVLLLYVTGLLYDLSDNYSNAFLLLVCCVLLSSLFIRLLALHNANSAPVSAK